jgi:psp operon transcriptional activator
MRPSDSSQNDTPRSDASEALGQSDAFLAFQEQLSRVARVDRPVLLVGERGTGKELAATRIHYLSSRWQEPLVALNCSALAPTLIESELFGHEAGAFTGAVRSRAGRFEAANGGTLFLDEIGNIPIVTQEKILRVVEYGAFERVGGSRSVQVNVRIVGATNANLPELVAEGRFKEDLLDRLSFEVLFVPPLRERREDILLLANHFAARMAFELGRKEVPEFDDEAIEELENYPWPGNVRELKNVVERAVYRADTSVITEIEFDPFRKRDYSAPEYAPDEEPAPEREHPSVGETLDKPLHEAVAELEVTLLRRALVEAKFNQRRAA